MTDGARKARYEYTTAGFLAALARTGWRVSVGACGGHFNATRCRLVEGPWKPACGEVLNRLLDAVARAADDTDGKPWRVEPGWIRDSILRAAALRSSGKGLPGGGWQTLTPDAQTLLREQIAETVCTPDGKPWRAPDLETETKWIREIASENTVDDGVGGTGAGFIQ